ncbi:DUF423 domain-containing protein [Alkalihalobacillus pseudalcaliphilus]|uniref:DUF423 domain-containing protein n=1 Tax=Alkalihalobacillus pseudalcaliphilus TaxID=79884 RepID=UPI00064E07A1|nr:DUF423 domain-containing protein [Alkalihalobacillus pseudalcaliphilus]KMK78197.1 membrane protein [Alkalihalobacillus pseudalcaliphilus]
MAKLFLLMGSIIMALVVAIGAFGAHGLEGKITERMLKNYQTGVQYHMIHGIGIIVVGLLALKMASNQLLTVAGWSFFIGIIFFSGSLYAMALTGITKLGAITPLGGVAFILGWILIGVAVTKNL